MSFAHHSTYPNILTLYITGLGSRTPKLDSQTPKPPQHKIPAAGSSPKKIRVPSERSQAPRLAGQGEDAPGLHYERKRKQVIDPDTGSVVGTGFASGMSYATYVVHRKHIIDQA